MRKYWNKIKIKILPKEIVNLKTNKNFSPDSN